MYDSYEAEKIYQQWAQIQQGTPQGDIELILRSELKLKKSEAKILATKLSEKYQKNRLTV
jgi:hypothetical protein